MKLAWDLSGVGLKSNSRAPQDLLPIVYHLFNFVLPFHLFIDHLNFSFLFKFIVAGISELFVF